MTIWYAASNGLATNPGTLASPWDIATSMTSASVVAGDTVNLVAGTYRVSGLRCTRVGTAAARIVYQNYLGQRVTVTCTDPASATGAVSTLINQGEYVDFIGLELTAETPNRTDYSKGPDLVSLDTVFGGTRGRYCRFINCIIHDGGIGIEQGRFSAGVEFIGCIIFYTGSVGPGTTRGGACFYVKNEPTLGVQKKITDCVFFFSCSHGIHCYSEGAATQGGSAVGIADFTVEGCIVFQSGINLDGTFHGTRNFLFGEAGSGGAALRITLRKCFGWFSTGGSGVRDCANFGLSKGIDYLDCQDSRFAGPSTALEIGTPTTNVTFLNNVITGPTTPSTLPTTYPTNTWRAYPASGTESFVRRNPYATSSRGHIVVYNWGQAASVVVNVLTDMDGGAFLAVGDLYEVRDVQNYYGTPQQTGTVPAGGDISVSMTSTTVAAPVGMTAPAHTSSLFGAFVIIKTGAGTPPAPADPTALAAGTTTATTIPISFTDNATDETAHDVEYKRAADALYTVIPDAVAGDPGTGTKNYTITGLQSGTVYDVRVRAYRTNHDPDNVSAYVGPIQAITQSSVPAAPSALVAGTPDIGSVPLSWVDNADNETSFEIEYRVPPTAFTGNPQVTGLSANTTSYILAGLVSATAHEARVRCRNAAGPSAWSNVVAFTTATAPQPPVQPSNHALTAPAYNQVSSSWTDNSTDETAFVWELDKDTSGAGLPGTFAYATDTLAAGVTSKIYTDPAGDGQQVYQARVRARNATGDSANAVSGEVATPPKVGPVFRVSPTYPSSPSSRSSPSWSGSPTWH